MVTCVHIIYNPSSGNGHSKAVLEVALQELAKSSVPCQVYPTQAAGHEDLLIEEILSHGYQESQERILVIGGDGTLHQTVNALVRRGKSYPIAYISGGTGNDFNRAWQSKASLEAIIENMLTTGKITQVKTATYHNLITKQEGVFLNAIGAGVDAETNYALIQSKQSGSSYPAFIKNLSYVFSIFPALKKLKLTDVTVTANGQIYSFKKSAIVSAMNHPYVGGGIQLNPQASTKDPLLACLVFHDIKISAIPRLLWQILISKKHVQANPHVTQIRADQLVIQSHDSLRCQIDGEDQGDHMIHYECKTSHYPFYMV